MMITISLMVVGSMAKAFEYILDLIIAILIIFIFPMSLLNYQKETLLLDSAANSLDRFVNLVSVKGYIARDIYDEVSESVSFILPRCEIVLEHKQRVHHLDSSLEDTYPIYNYIYTEDIIEELNTGDNRYYFNHGDRIRLKLIKDGRLVTYVKSETIRGGS